MTTVFYRGEQRDAASFTPEERAEFLQEKRHNIAEAQKTIDGINARIAELERVAAMHPVRRWFYRHFGL